jgi:biopolymer transport protein ExbD
MRVVLPSSQTSTDAAVRNQVNLTVTADLHYLIEDKEITFEQIEPLLVSELAAKPETQETVVLLHADKSLNLQNIVDLFDIGNKLKVKMILFTQKEKK